jgi:RhoGAP domain
MLWVSGSRRFSPCSFYFSLVLLFPMLPLVALSTEGVFRLSGSAKDIEDYRAAYDRGDYVNVDPEPDHHTVAGVLKLYLRELGEPLLTFDLFHEFLAADCMYPS